MTRLKFGMLFIIAATSIIVALEYYDLTKLVSPYIVVFIMSAYFIGQYSARFPKR